MNKFPYIHYRNFSDGRETILVRLSRGRRILMMIREDWRLDTDLVIFANPQKLAPVMDEINAVEEPSRLEYLNARARVGIEAARTNARVISPMPMGVALLVRGKIRFEDGIGRTSELINQQAEFVPLQVSRQHVHNLQSMIGMDDMPPQPVTSYIIPRKCSKNWISDAACGDINRHKVNALMCHPLLL